MKMKILLMIVGGLAIMFLPVDATLNPDGTKCGSEKCSTIEYCSPFDSRCKPCADICDSTSHNHEPAICVKDCQEYLHDRRYVLRTDLSEYQDLKGEIHRLRVLFAITLSITCLGILAILYMLCKAFVRWENIRRAVERICSKKWIKKTTSNNKIQDDVEANAPKQNGLKLTMPTISGAVATSHSASTNGNGNGTPNTTSTPLSRRHPSEDTTLDYAYDNPAMTPSPETAQQRTKRESSF